MTRHCEGDVWAALPWAANRTGVKMFSSSQKRDCSGFIQKWMPITLVMEWFYRSVYEFEVTLYMYDAHHSVSNFYKWHAAHAKALRLLSCLSPLVHVICRSILNFDLVTCPVISFSVQTDVKGFWSLLTFILLLIHEHYTVISKPRMTLIWSKIHSKVSLQCRRIVDARVHIFSYLVAILDLATVEDWGKEIFPEEVGINWKKWSSI